MLLISSSNCEMVNVWMQLIALVVLCRNRDCQCLVLFAGVLPLQFSIVGDSFPLWNAKPRCWLSVTGIVTVVDEPNVSSVISS